MRTLSLGKCRGLAQVSTPHHAISILALDHRNNLRNALNPAEPQTVKDEDMWRFKQLVVRTTAPNASAVLLDPQVGAAQCIASADLPGTCGLVCAVEETGYTGDPTARKSQILPGWSVAQAKRLGSSAIKLLVYYHPDSPSAAEIEELVCSTAQACEENEMPFFLEPLSYSLDASKKKLPSEEKRRVVVETARRLTPLGADILKAEFPLDAAAAVDENEWRAACEELTQASMVPWVLLSASVEYEDYLRQVDIACRSGASGVAAGRAVWKEATSLSQQERYAFLIETAASRMQRLTELCDAIAQPWTAYFNVPQPQPDWYLING